MDRKQEFRAGKTQSSPAIDTHKLIIEALTFFGANQDQGQRFFAWSGLDAGSLRSATADPGFPLGLLDYFAENLASLERFCESAGLAPGEVIRWHEAMKARGLTSHDEV